MRVTYYKNLSNIDEKPVDSSKNLSNIDEKPVDSSKNLSNIDEKPVDSSKNLSNKQKEVYKIIVNEKKVAMKDLERKL